MNDSDKELGEILSAYAWSSDSEMGDHNYTEDDAIKDIKAWVRGKCMEFDWKMGAYPEDKWQGLAIYTFIERGDKYTSTTEEKQWSDEMKGQFE
jgi:hypothetical protein